MKREDKLMLSFLLAMGFLMWFAFWSAGAFAGDLPDPALTPGAYSPLVTQANIHQTVCVHGWSKTMRPSTSVTNKMKVKVMVAYHIPLTDIHKVELDHLCSIVLGCALDDEHNMWPEYWYLNVDGEDHGAHQKDHAEKATQLAICSGKITLLDAQKQMVTDWRVLYKRFYRPEFPKYVEH